jgi:diguanylate cyclase (GGDEF)-like protein
VLLRDATMTQGVALGERLREEVARLRLPHERSAHGVVTVSAGVAGIEPRLHAMDDGYPQLIRDADRALARAKHAGRNRVEAGLPGIGS